MQAFEYKIVTSTESSEDDETSLNELGAEGWELVAVHVSEMTFMDSGEEEDDEEDEESEEYVEEVVTYYLKRAKA